MIKKLFGFTMALLILFILIIIESGCSAYCKLINKDEQIKRILRSDSLDCADKLWLIKGWSEK